MGLTKFKMAVNVLSKYMDDTGKDYIFTEPLRKLVAQYIGGDENRTLVPTLKMMREFGLITETEVNKWKINLSSTPGKNKQ